MQTLLIVWATLVTGEVHQHWVYYDTPYECYLVSEQLKGEFNQNNTSEYTAMDISCVVPVSI
jgi:hypothetical protein